MIILGIETSCDETALSLIDADAERRISADRTRMAPMKRGVRVTIRVLADKTLSQIELHKRYGGVFPNMAKREHSRNLVPLLKIVLDEAGFGNSKFQAPNSKQIQNSKSEKLKAKSYKLKTILDREQELLANFLEFIHTIEKPQIDAISVTEGPGLEPCLWTGVNLARALSFVWDIPVIPVNHMEGHVFSALLRKTEISNSPNYLISNKIPDSRYEKLNAKRYTLNAPEFPALALLISGGHTELVLIKDWFKYQIIGQTRDDAVGEAFDKVARLLGLPYPGGPEISRLAEAMRRRIQIQGPILYTRSDLVRLPRPMIHSTDFDFSFSGLKTAVLYLTKKLPELTLETKRQVAREFEDAVTEVLVAKTKNALEQYGARTLLVGGGVIANTHLRRSFKNLANAYCRRNLLKSDFLHIPEQNLTTDNALMIAVAGYARLLFRDNHTKVSEKVITPNGNLSLGES